MKVDSVLNIQRLVGGEKILSGKERSVNKMSQEQLGFSLARAAGVRRGEERKQGGWGKRRECTQG